MLPVSSGRPHRSGEGAVRAAELRVDPTGAEADHTVAQAKPAQHADAVGLNRHAGAHLGERRRLLVEVHVDAALQECQGGRRTADAAADDGDTQGSRAHGRSPSGVPMYRPRPIRPFSSNVTAMPAALNAAQCSSCVKRPISCTSVKCSTPLGVPTR